MDASKGNILGIEEGFQEFGSARNLIRHWVTRAVNRLNEAHGKPLIQP
jgi:hypothetical protein